MGAPPCAARLRSDNPPPPHAHLPPPPLKAALESGIENCAGEGGGAEADGEGEGEGEGQGGGAKGGGGRRKGKAPKKGLLKLRAVLKELRNTMPASPS